MKTLLALVLMTCCFAASGATTFINPTLGTTTISKSRSFPFDSQLLYYWTFDQTDSVWDSSSQWHTDAVYPNGDATNRMFWGQSSAKTDCQPGAIGQGFAMASAAGQLGRVTNLYLTNVQLMTISLWIRPTNVSGWNGDKMIIEGGTANWTLQTNSIIIDSGNGSRLMNFGIRDPSNLNSNLLVQCGNVTNIYSNSWNHLAVVFDNTPATGRIKFYANGTNVTLSTLSNTKNQSTSFGNHFWAFGNRGSGSLNIGATYDEVRIYSNELTQAQISMIYTSRFTYLNQ